MTFLPAPRALASRVWLCLWLLAWVIWPRHVFGFSNHQEAELVLGQPDMVSNGSDCTATALTRPYGVHALADELAVADTLNSRALYLYPWPGTNGASADAVVGQPDMTSSGTGCTASSFSQCYSVCMDGSRLFAVDYLNNRVLIFQLHPLVNGEAAVIVVGQSNMTSSGSGLSASQLSRPTGVACDGTRLFIADNLNNRVLIFNTIPAVNGASADVVVGQPNMTSSGSGLSATQLSRPWGVYSNGSQLFIADNMNNRVLIYNNIPTANNAAADIVVGQDSMTTNAGTVVAANRLTRPSSMTTDDTGRLYVADQYNHRVLIYNTIPAVNGASANVVLGQPDFTSNSANNGGVSASSLSYPYGVSAHQGVLWVADTWNNRILKYSAGEIFTPTSTITGSATTSPTPSHTNTPTVTPTSSASPTASPTPTATGSPSVTASSSATSSRTPTSTPTLSGTVTASATATPTETPTATATATATGTETSTGTPTPTTSATDSATATSTGTATPSETITPMGSATPTPSGTATASHTPVLTPTPTLTPGATFTASGTPQATATPSPTPPLSELTVWNFRMYPNPFVAGRESATLAYTLTRDASVRLEIFSYTGAQLRTLEFRPGEEGGRGNPAGYTNHILWDGRNALGKPLAVGGYICRLTVHSVHRDQARICTLKVGILRP